MTNTWSEITLIWENQELDICAKSNGIKSILLSLQPCTENQQLNLKGKEKNSTKLVTKILQDNLSYICQHYIIRLIQDKVMKSNPELS